MSLSLLLKKLKEFSQSDKNKNKCTPKYTLKLLSDQFKYGQPIYQSKHASQQFDTNKMETFQFEVFFDSNSNENLKGELFYCIFYSFQFRQIHFI